MRVNAIQASMPAAIMPGFEVSGLDAFCSLPHRREDPRTCSPHGYYVTLVQLTGHYEPVFTVPQSIPLVLGHQLDSRNLIRPLLQELFQRGIEADTSYFQQSNHQ